MGSIAKFLRALAVVFALFFLIACFYIGDAVYRVRRLVYGRSR